MKKAWLALLLLVFMLPALTGCAQKDGGDEKVFVASFYPMYLLTQQVAAGAPGVSVVCMAEQNTGCLHDYQLGTRDMVTLDGAAALVVSGGGMEQFMDRIAATFPDMPVITASEGIGFLPNAHDGEGAFNAHVWLDPKLAARQVENIAAGLTAADPDNAEIYAGNAKDYTEKLLALDAELADMLAPAAGKRIITFHEAFTYFADAYHLDVAGVIEHEPGEEPGTRELADTCDLVRELGVSALFVEPQYPARSAETIARETGASIYTLDPIVTGDGAADSYEKTMRENARVLLEALCP